MPGGNPYSNKCQFTGGWQHLQIRSPLIPTHQSVPLQQGQDYLFSLSSDDVVGCGGILLRSTQEEAPGTSFSNVVSF